MSRHPADAQPIQFVLPHTLPTGDRIRPALAYPSPHVLRIAPPPISHLVRPYKLTHNQ